MFVMTSDIKVGPFKPFKVHSVTWRRGIDNYSDSCLIKIPAIALLKTTGDQYTQVESGLQFKEGMNVSVSVGYDGRNYTRFKGFIKRINYTVPCELECEGFSYQLRNKLDINKSYPRGTSMKTILADLIEGTGIVLSKSIPDVSIQSPVVYRRTSGVQVLDWFKEKMLQTVYFNFNELYVGLRETEIKKNVRFRLGWNTIKDNDLKFSSQKEFAQVKFVLKQRERNGQYTEVVHDSKFTDTKVKRIGVRLTDDYLQKMADDEKKKLVNRGYEGGITAFGIPYIEPGDSAQLEDTRYTERTGRYFVEAVEGSFGPQGIRQKIKIGNSLGSG